jgi:hypothetical protein
MTAISPRPPGWLRSPGSSGSTVTPDWRVSSRDCGPPAAEPDMELDLARLLATLHRHKVAFVLIGGLAAVYHGSPFPTEDAGITPAADDLNLDRLAAALRELNARNRTADAPEGVLFACDATGLATAQTWNLVTDAGDLDITFRPSGTQGYPDLRRDSISADIYDVTVLIASLADVIRSKQAANRPKDQRVLPTLRAILARSREGGRG